LTTIPRLAVSAAAVVVAGLGLNAMHPGGLLTFGSDMRTLPQAVAGQHYELEKRNELQKRWAVVAKRIEAKRDIVLALVGKHMTLRAAARKFQILANATPSEVRCYAKEKFQTCAGEAELCRQVIAYVKAELASEPDLAASVVTRLSRELEDQPL
jgi:hypothetical protein